MLKAGDLAHREDLRVKGFKIGRYHMYGGYTAKAIRTTVVPIRILIRTTVVPITPLIGTTVVQIRILMGTTGI